MVDTACGAMFITARSSWLLATPGSPTWAAPRGMASEVQATAQRGAQPNWHPGAGAGEDLCGASDAARCMQGTHHQRVDVTPQVRAVLQRLLQAAEQHQRQACRQEGGKVGQGLQLSKRVARQGKDCSSAPCASQPLQRVLSGHPTNAVSLGLATPLIAMYSVQGLRNADRQQTLCQRLCGSASIHPS